MNIEHLTKSVIVMKVGNILIKVFKQFMNKANWPFSKVYKYKIADYYYYLLYFKLNPQLPVKVHSSFL